MISGFCFLCLERSNMGWLPGKRPCGGKGRLWGLFWFVLPWLLWLYRWSSVDDPEVGGRLTNICFRLLTNLLLLLTRPLAAVRSICSRAVLLSLSFFTSDIRSPNLQQIRIQFMTATRDYRYPSKFAINLSPKGIANFKTYIFHMQSSPNIEFC